MDRRRAVAFLFSVATEIKRSYESPAILFTKKDYADGIFKSLVEMHDALLAGATPDRIVDIITSAHYVWLNAVKEIEEYKNRITNVPREQIYSALDFTIERSKERNITFKKFVDQLNSTMSEEESHLMQTDLNTIADMHLSVNSVIDNKNKCLRSTGDPSEFKAIVSIETEELMNWLDTLNDHLVLQFSKVVGIKYPELLTDLTNTLDNIVDEVAASADPRTLELMNDMHNKRMRLSCVIRLNPTEELEMRKIIEKIKSLESRIERLKLENSSAVMALQHKTMYLEERLHSLENVKLSLNTLKNKRIEDIRTKRELKCQEVHIFDHLLPSDKRKRLVEELVTLWHEAVYGDHEKKSIISILSVADMKEVYSDEFGHFTVDKYGRKLYKGSKAEHMYQINHRKELVPVADDEKHVYFYDDCGRYYLSEQTQRIYKAHENASEYLINKDGMLLKFKEVIDGVEYRYDSLGRYRLHKSGKKIYSDPKSDEEYENDGMGNLVRIRNTPIEFTECPAEPVATEEMKYLQRVIGTALKTCIADVILHQPLDPVLYLANRLDNYDKNIKNKERQLKEGYEMLLEREELARGAKPPAAHSASGESTSDSNFLNYESML